MLRRILKLLWKTALGLLGILIIYLLVSVICTYTPVNHRDKVLDEHTIYLTTNGVHVDFIIPEDCLSPTLKQGVQTADYRFFAFGWGDRDFYLHTPEWSDLTISTAVNAAFLPSPTLMHVTRYHRQSPRWLPVHLSSVQLKSLNDHIHQRFKMDKNGHTIKLADTYGEHDLFYEAEGNYNAFYTCNTWVNEGLKNAGLPACIWTPYDFGIMRLYD